MNQTILSLPSITFFFLMLRTSSSSLDSIAVHQNLLDGETIISENATFELGFFSPGNSRNRYVGIWYKNTTPHVVVWVANRETPFFDTSGIVKLDSQGTLSLVNGSGITIWSSHSSTWKWTQDLYFPSDKCDDYGVCGPHGICSINAYNICGCLKGFELKNPQEMPQDNWSSGCRRIRPLDCAPDEGFMKFSSLKLPDTQNAVYDNHMSLQECEVACKSNCSCTAYANPNMTEGAVGCLLWFGDLIDLRVYSQNGQDLYVRLAATELLVNSTTSNNGQFRSRFPRKKRVIVIITISTSAGLAVILVLYTLNKRKRRPDAKREAKILDKEHNSSSKKGNRELTVFRLSAISRATNKFSVDNILGQGGFGPVYKGVLEEGQEIAVKRLSKSSKQGLDEFENEVICIAKLQHRNLVKLLGYCINGEETLLVYEYMPNKSLDWFIFDDLRKSLLDWPQRFHIIHGVARGLLYLHQDSRLRVIHRDLKASNILLDHEMNPKISDFGLARMFEGNESEAKTKKVVGTLGYISPEYAANGVFSVKSDIFSYGVLVLELVSGKKNSVFSHEDHCEDNLLGHAWRLYREGKSIELIDASLGESWSTYEVLRSIHIGLLCVQQRAEDRPTTAVVVAMLSGEGSLPPPKKPAFFVQGSESDLVSVRPTSVNGVTISQIDGR
ncbi:putative protein kinase RLK-Pelle-DLSV family [Helianthus annuus]|nr:putative protein kinase RLK-Pelle-DLSV family [Helianthus annuus]